MKNAASVQSTKMWNMFSVISLWPVSVTDKKDTVLGCCPNAKVQKTTQLREMLELKTLIFSDKFQFTVEPLYNGHHWDPTFCPL